MATLLVMMRDLAERLGRDSHFPVTGTATGGTTTTLIDDGTTTPPGLVYSSGDANTYDRKWVYQETNAETSRVTEGGYAGSTGTLTFSPAITTFGSGTPKYIICDWPFPVLKNAINRVQRNIFLPTFWPLSLHVMGNDANDMEPSTIATDYSATNGTRATESTIIFNGAQSFKLTASAAAGYANTGNINVPESKQLVAGVACSVTQGDDATFRVWDVTNSASIDTGTSDEPAWTDLIVPFSVPSGCEQMDLRMISDANGDVVYWDDIQLWSQGTEQYPLPSWITRPEQVLDVRYFRQGTASTGTNAYITRENGSRPLTWDFESVDKRATSELFLKVKSPGFNRPYVYALRPLDELTADTTNSVAEQDFVVRWAEKLVREPDEAAETMALLRAIHFQRVTTELPTRLGVRIR